MRPVGPWRAATPVLTDGVVRLARMAPGRCGRDLRRLPGSRDRALGADPVAVSRTGSRQSLIDASGRMAGRTGPAAHFADRRGTATDEVVGRHHGGYGHRSRGAAATIGRTFGYWVAGSLRGGHRRGDPGPDASSSTGPWRRPTSFGSTSRSSPDNEASQTVAARCGFTAEGTLRVDVRPPGRADRRRLVLADPPRCAPVAGRRAGCGPPRAGIGHPPGYTPLRDIHSAYSLCIRSRGAPCRRARRASPETGRSRTSSRSSPGPRREPTSSSTRPGRRRACPRAYPIVPVRGDGLTVEDIDGNLFLDFAAGIAVNSTGHAHPQVVAAIKEQAAELIHFSASDFYLPIYPEVCRELARIAPISGPARASTSATPGTEVVEASIKLARYATEAAVHRRVPGRLPRPDLRLGLADGLEGEVPRRLRAAAARASSTRRTGRSRTCAGSTRSCSTSSPRPTRSRRSSSSRSRARAATSSPRTASSRASASICDQHGILLDRRRDPVGRRADRQDVGGRALGRRARHPADRQGHRVRHDRSARWSPGPTCSRPGVRARTARPTAATRSPAPRPSRRSSCSRAASSTTPRSAASRRMAGLRPLHRRASTGSSATSAARA